MEQRRIIVDAIDDGRIVRVPEEYAIREGLPILRRKELSFTGSPERKPFHEVQKREMKLASGFDTFRRPLKTKENDVRSTLKDNFHWDLVKFRKERNLTRKQLAKDINVPELDIKMIENGILPSEDYVLISKLEQYLHISLRKDGYVSPQLSTLSTISPIKKTSSATEQTQQPKVKERKPMYKYHIEDRWRKQREQESPQSQPAQLLGDDIEIEYDQEQ